jgi:hypothetical protein
MKTQKMMYALLFCLTGAFCHAGVFPESDAIWNIHVNGIEHYYGLSGDTLIEDKSYNKLYQLNDTTLTIGVEDIYMGGFRQEGKKVLYRPAIPDYKIYDHMPTETILYDFSKNEGDTIWHNFIPNLSISYWIIEDSITASIITSMEIDEQGRKIYHTEQYLVHYGDFTFLKEDIWIEGIGSIQHGLFWFLHLKAVSSGRPVFRLVCFKEGGEVKYMDNTRCNSCFCWSSTGTLDKKSFSPEVVCENNHIQVKGEPLLFPCELKLFSPMGQPVLEKRLQSGEEKIQVAQPGIYLYRIQRNEEIIKTGKIIIK